jgi:hypothetical protein
MTDRDNIFINLKYKKILTYRVATLVAEETIERLACMMIVQKIVTLMVIMWNHKMDLW